MSTIQQIIQQQLTPEAMDEISNAIGADNATTQSAINSAIPMMMGGMAANASDPAAAEMLALKADEHSGMLDGLMGALGGSGGALGGSGGVLGGLGGLLGGGAAGSILGQVLGSSHSNVEDGVTRASGLDAQKAGKLLMILGPIVLAAISRHRQQTNASPVQVSRDLQNEAEAHAQNEPRLGGLIGSILNKATGQS
ncbi:MAG: DUF937 domain-containing protein [Gemmatimonadaceae bacterium]